MEKDSLNILIFGHTTFGTRHLKIRKEAFKVLVSLLGFLQLSVTFFLCDYVQVKKRQLDLNQLRQESQIQKVEIQFFTTKIEEVEKKLAKLKVIDQRIRTIANLEKNQENTPFIAMGGASYSPAPEKVIERK